MKPRQFSLTELLGVVVAFIALAFAAGHSLRTSTLKHPSNEQKSQTESPSPWMQSSLHVPRSVVDVGSVSAEASGLAEFTIENKGTTTIRLVYGSLIGRGRLDAESEDFSIAPGESREIEVHWRTPRSWPASPQNTALNHRIVSCMLATSDPNRRWIEVAVVGQCGPP